MFCATAAKCVLVPLVVFCSPVSSYACTIVGFTCFGAGKHVESVQAGQRAVELDSGVIACWCLHLALYYGGRFEEAVSVGIALDDLRPPPLGGHEWGNWRLCARSKRRIQAAPLCS